MTVLGRISLAALAISSAVAEAKCPQYPDDRLPKETTRAIQAGVAADAKAAAVSGELSLSTQATATWAERLGTQTLEWRFYMADLCRGNPKGYRQYLMDHPVGAASTAAVAPTSATTASSGAGPAMGATASDAGPVPPAPEPAATGASLPPMDRGPADSSVAATPTSAKHRSVRMAEAWSTWDGAILPPIGDGVIVRSDEHWLTVCWEDRAFEEAYGQWHMAVLKGGWDVTYSHDSQLTARARPTWERDYQKDGHELRMYVARAQDVFSDNQSCGPDWGGAPGARVTLIQIIEH